MNERSDTLESRKKIERRAKRAYAVFACLMLSMAVMIAPAFATIPYRSWRI